MAYSIANEIEYEAVVAEIVMLRAASHKAIILLEGSSDEKFFDHFLSHNTCDVVIGWGRRKAMDALAQATRRGVQGILCILDQDYDSFRDGLPDDPNIILTDEHDLEIMLVRSSAFDRVLVEMGSAQKIDALRAQGVNLAEHIRESVHPLGMFRLFSLKEKVHLKFDGLRYVYLDNKLKQDRKEMFREVHNHSRVFGYDEKKISDYLDEMEGNGHDRWLMCCGHDVCMAFGKALQSLLGSQNPIKCTGSEIESRLRLAFGVEDLTSTRFYAEIKNWEISNPPYRCLRL